ncbi:MAG: bacteriohemerythrin [Gammaproteobacteria bacterium]|nr:bacteriohemerythrin [Gammaproteobacteria bacterium]
MAYWEWSDALSVGVEEIDRQHKRIIEYINQLDKAIYDRNPGPITEIIKGLTNYTLVHFEFEEDLMHKIEYPLLDEHSKTHTSFKNRMTDYQQRFDAGEDISRKLLTDLRIWLTNHIKKDDQDYAPLLRQVDHKPWWNKALHTLLR